MGLFNEQENGAIVPVVAIIVAGVIFIALAFFDKQELAIHGEALAACVAAGMEYVDGDCKVPVQSD